MPSGAFYPTDPWFIDYDDGTIFHLFDSGGAVQPSTGDRTPSVTIRYQQDVNAGDCSALTGFGGNPLIMQTPLPADFAMESGGISRFSDRLSLFIEEFTPSRVSEDTQLVGINLNNPAKTFITRYDFVNVESFGVSSGAPNQTYTVSGSAIIAPTLGTATVFIGGLSGNKWTQVTAPELATAAATAKFFTYDATIGQVTFGNGVHGAIPPEGEEIVLRISIRNGGGKWEFAGVIVPPTDSYNIGGVKPIKDKIFYVRTKNAAADISKMTTVHSVLNTVTYNLHHFPTGTLLAKMRIWTAALGSTITADGGEIVTFNIGVTTAFVDKKVVFDHSVDCGDQCVDIDTGVVYPSMAGSTPDQIPALSSTLGIYTEPTKFTGGIIASPKKYRVDMTLFPILHVVEVIRYGVMKAPVVDIIEAGNCGAPLEFYPLPAYYLSFGVWIPQTPLAFDCSHQIFGGIIDSDGESQAANTFAPIRHGRVPRLVEMGDLTGTYDDPIALGYHYDDDPIPPSPLNKKYNRYVRAGEFTYRKNGDSSFHPELVKFVYETKSDSVAKAYEQHITGANFPEFTTEWTAEMGNNTDLEVVNADAFPTLVCSCQNLGPTAVPIPKFYDAVYGFFGSFGYPDAFFTDGCLTAQFGCGCLSSVFPVVLQPLF